MPSSPYRLKPNSRKGQAIYLGVGLGLAALAFALILGHGDTSSSSDDDKSADSTVAPGTTRIGVVNGCNTYGENCEGNPIYEDVPPVNYDWTTEPKLTTVPNGTELEARCWEIGGTTWNYAAKATPPDHGPDPYDSDIVFNVRVPDADQWGFIPDTYFVRDQARRMGLPRCAELEGKPS